MPCYHPITAYRSSIVGDSGKRRLVFSPQYGHADRKVVIPCGQCVGCRLEKSRQWAIRCMHEASLYDDNCFITLTYASEHLPANHSISKPVFQKFMKRLRKRFSDRIIRFYACGEYGELRNRPHYHAILFNLDFPDKRLWSKKNGNVLFRSAILESLWPYGYCSIGNVTFESAAYVARYVMKKVTGDNAADAYKIFDKETGEIYDIEPEFALMSRRPGIGRVWYDKYSGDTDKDFITVNGVKCKIPKYYDTVREKFDEEFYEDVKWNRRAKAALHKADQTPSRLQSREKVHEAKAVLLKRNVEEMK